MFSDHSGAQCTGGGEDVLVDVYTSDGRTVPAEVRPLGSSPGSSHAFLSRYNSQNVSISFEIHVWHAWLCWFMRTVITNKLFSFVTKPLSWPLFWSSRNVWGETLRDNLNNGGEGDSILSVSLAISPKWICFVFGFLFAQYFYRLHLILFCTLLQSFWYHVYVILMLCLCLRYVNGRCFYVTCASGPLCSGYLDRYVTLLLSR